MKADDPRHGTVAGHIAHQREGGGYCDACIAAKARYDKSRKWAAHTGNPFTVSSLGARRRLQSLQALGWSRQRVAEAAGWKTTGALNYLMRHDTITRSTHDRIAAAFEALCMKQPPDVMAARRARTWAARHGYAPPLAWDDIDDPGERPTDWAYQPTDRTEAVREFNDMGLGVTEVCRRLRMSANTLQIWCARRGLSDVYRQIAARESIRGEQFMGRKDGAA